MLAYRTVRAGRSEVWEQAVAGGPARLLISSPEWHFVKPVWSPDGAKLAVLRCAATNGPVAVAVLNADGTGERLLTAPEDVEMVTNDWSKDGQHLIGACRFNPDERYSTCLVPAYESLVGQPPTVQVIASDATRNLFNQRFSPDQRWISFLAHDLAHSSASTIYVMPAGGGPWQSMTDGNWFDDKPRWSPDGRLLYFVSNRSGQPNVWARRFDPSTGTRLGEPFPVTTFRSPGFQLTERTVQMDIAVTHDRLFLPMSESRSEIWLLDRVNR